MSVTTFYRHCVTLTDVRLEDVQPAVNAIGGRLYWFSLTGTNVTLSGNQDEHDWGWIDPYDVPWWEAAPVTQPPGGLVRETASHLIIAQAGLQANRPHFFQFNANGSVIRWMKVRKPIAWGISVSGNDNPICGWLSLPSVDYIDILQTATRSTQHRTSMCVDQSSATGPADTEHLPLQHRRV